MPAESLRAAPPQPVSTMPTRRQPVREPIVEQLAIAVSVERAWQALTHPRTIGDIVLGHVEMDCRPGRPFVWHWGVWEKSAPRKVDGCWRGTVLDVVPGAVLVLGGTGQPTVTLTIKGQGTACLVTVVQGPGPAGADLESSRYRWADFLLKLKTLLEPPALFDALYLRTLVRAAPGDILKAFLSGATLGKLLPGRARVQARPQGRFEWQWKDSAARAAGTLLEFEKNHRLALAWEATAPVSEVRIEATRAPYGTIVSLAHLNLGHGNLSVAASSPARDREGYRRLWARLLERLRCYFFYGRKIRTAY
jgi:uncharacterized protein YndB with AHSA1/START domain